MKLIFKTWWILLLVPIAVFILAWLKTKQRQVSLKFSSTELFRQTPVSWKLRFQFIPWLLRVSAFLLFLIALAGPRMVTEKTVHHAEGIDILLALDVSGSMAGEDFTINNRRTNRLDIIKMVVSDFINQRQNDRIGIVAFAGRAYTVCPLTTDYAWLHATLDRMSLNLIDSDGTAIGSALATAVGRLKTSTAKSRIIILLTDGMNNAGKVEPTDAAKAAAALGLKIYTIGAGSKGQIPYPATDMWGRKVYQMVQSDLDEKTLQKIAELTNGQYYRATDTESLKKIYATIDRLEKTKIEEVGYFEYKELFEFLVLLGLILLLIDYVLSQTIFLRIP